MKFILILLPLLFNLGLAQSEQAYPPLNLVSIPTAGTLPRGSFTFETLIVNNGGIIPKLCVGFTDNFSLGISYGIHNFIGEDKLSINKTTPEVQIKYRVFDESEIMPAIIYGLDTQGRGNYNTVDSIFNDDGIFTGRTIELNRYDQKAWGLYMVLSKNWNFFGNLGLHIGGNSSLTENDDDDTTPNFFIGIDKELNRSFSLLLEFDAALNDDERSLDIKNITFGKGYGYLNAGVRWAISPNLMLEVNLNDINRNTDAKYTNREIKVMYSESF